MKIWSVRGMCSLYLVNARNSEEAIYLAMNLRFFYYFDVNGDVLDDNADKELKNYRRFFFAAPWDMNDETPRVMDSYQE